MKKIIFIPALFLFLVFTVAGDSQVSSPVIKSESEKDTIWLVPSSFGEIPNAFCQPDYQPYVSSEDLYHPVSINPGPWVGTRLDTKQNKEVFLGYRQINSQLLKDPMKGIGDGDTCAWLAVLGLCMLAVVSPVESGY